MSDSRLQQLADFGQSVWLDYISRPLIETGQLQELIDGGLRGMTSNPSIFNAAIGNSKDYDEKIVELNAQNKSTFEIYDELSIKDIQDAADIFDPIYKSTQGLDGYVSLEINPLLANKVDEQIAEGVRLYEKVARKNVMIKVPSTPEGIQVVEELISRGINVNVTLIFSLSQYEQTAKAYLNGLEKLAQSGGDLGAVRSVASVFVSRVDSAVDKLLDEKADDASKGLLGKAAVANCRVIFAKYEEIFNSDQAKALVEKGANIQRVLWGSTSTKNPEYNDVKYVEELITAPTVNTIPEKTLHCFIDHGKVQEAFDYDASQSQAVIDGLSALEIDLNAINQKLLEDGCVAFNQAFEELLDSIEKKAKQLSMTS